MSEEIKGPSTWVKINEHGELDVVKMDTPTGMLQDDDVTIILSDTAQEIFDEALKKGERTWNG